MPSAALETTAARLSPAKRALLEQRLRGLGAGRAGAIPPRPAGSDAPVSDAQRRLWALHQWQPDSPAYHVPTALRLDGDLDIDALRRALAGIWRRHEGLRARFALAGDGLRQSFAAPDAPPPCPVIDLGAYPETGRETRLLDHYRELAGQPFDLGTGPLLRLGLARLSETRHVLIVVLHHIVCDGWSMGVLIRELECLYRDFRAGRPVSLPEPALQYADYAAWQHWQWANGALQTRLDDGRRRLAGAPVLELPTTIPPDPVAAGRGAAHAFELSPAVARRLKGLALEAGTGLFAVLHALFLALLYRHSGQRDLVVGTVVANRDRPELENLIGFFVNALALRVRIEGNPSFRELLAQVGSTDLEAFSAQDLPFDRLVEALKLPWEAGRNPLFRVSLALHNLPRTEPDFPGLKVSTLEFPETATQFDLTLHVHDVGEGLEAAWVYDAGRFAPGTIARLARHYQTLAVELLDHPDRPIGAAAMLDESETAALLELGCSGAAIPPPWRGLHGMFEAQAASGPERPALAHAGRRLGYGELNARANRLAHALRGLGVGPESRVAVCLPRGFDLIAAILGVLKAGAAYVPVDPAYPAGRVAYLLQDSGAALALTLDGLADSIAQAGVPALRLDRDIDLGTGLPADNPGPLADAANAAYLIYTSGSTGQPKGVVVSHANALASTWARFSVYEQPVGGFLLLSSFAFDSSVAGIFWTLGQGGLLCLPTDEDSRDPMRMAELIAAERLTHVLCLPAFHRLLLARPGLLGSLRVAIVAGESCPPVVAEEHFRALPDARLYNEYGPTEVSVWSSVRELGPETAAASAVPIGRPIPGIRAYLLDACLNPVPWGCPGEVYLAGTGVARGYHGSPGATAPRFLPDPFGPSGSRMYRSGDLARWRGDGALEFLGRADHQVKIRGFRVELGEVESRLLEHPALREAAALALPAPDGSLRLVAYWAAREGTAPATAELLAFLRERLPEHALPAAFVQLDALPSTPNGKLDRAALPEPTQDAARAGAEYLAPRDGTERELAALWAEILGLAQVGIRDDFFALGGHSILAAQLLFRIRERYPSAPGLRDLFALPTIEAQAALLAGNAPGGIVLDLEQEAQREFAELPPIHPARPGVHWEHALLTGASGFLGGYLLRELLDRSAGTVHCLVRAGDAAEGWSRLRRNLERYGLWREAYADRVVAVPGDLAAPRLGLDGRGFEALAAEVEAIYHNGALVNFALPYAGLKAANVVGTREVLRLALTGTAKPLHYVSTMSVFGDAVAADPAGHGEADFPPALAVARSDGYSQSKWVAERLVRLAMERGLTAAIYRPSGVVGDSRSGLWDSGDFLQRLAQGCLDLGIAPAGDESLNLIPVDHTAAALAFLSLRPGSTGRAFHLIHGEEFRTGRFVETARALGYRLEVLPWNEWVREIRRRVGARAGHPLYPLLPMFAETEEENAPDPAGNPRRYDGRATFAALEQGGIACPALDRDVLARFLSRWRALPATDGATA